MRRLRRANHAVSLAPADMELKMDLFFQLFNGAAHHSNLDSVVKMVKSDISFWGHILDFQMLDLKKNCTESGNLGKIVRFAIHTKPDFVLIEFVLSEDSL